jgi:hypothetical protein
MFHGWYQDSNKTMFIITDYVSGGNLDEYMRRDRPGIKASCREVTIQLLKAIDALHLHSICHRDLKPSVCLPLLLKTQFQANYFNPYIFFIRTFLSLHSPHYSSRFVILGSQSHVSRTIVL